MRKNIQPNSNLRGRIQAAFLDTAASKQNFTEQDIYLMFGIPPVASQWPVLWLQSSSLVGDLYPERPSAVHEMKDSWE